MDVTKPVKSICVFCGSSPGTNPAYVPLASSTGSEIASRGYGLVYGGGGTGLMGATAKAVRKQNGYVLGIVPEFLLSPERAYGDIEQRIVLDMHTRKLQMYNESDAFIVLPGGIGTLEEAVEIMCWLRLQLHQKPILFLSPDGYWDGLLSLLTHTVESRFTPGWVVEDILTAKTSEDALVKIEAYWKAPKRELEPITPVLKDM